MPSRRAVGAAWGHPFGILKGLGILDALPAFNFAPAGSATVESPGGSFNFAPAGSATVESPGGSFNFAPAGSVQVV